LEQPHTRSTDILFQRSCSFTLPPIVVYGGDRVTGVMSYTPLEYHENSLHLINTTKTDN